MLVHDFMGANVFQFKLRAVILTPKSFIKWKGFETRIEPQKVTSFFFELLDTMTEQSFAKALSVIIGIGGHAAKAVRKFRREIRMIFLDEGGDRKQSLAAKKAVVKCRRELITRIDAISFAEKRFEHRLSEAQGFLGRDCLNREI